MKFQIPFTFSDIDKLKKKSRFFIKNVKHIKQTKLGDDLRNSGIEITREEYISICKRSAINFFMLSLIFAFVFFIVLSRYFYYLPVINIVLFSLGLSVLFTLFVSFSQRIYPQIYVSRRQKDIEKNLLSALQDISIQLSSGIPLFGVMTNISFADYGELSVEFRKAVKRINGGEPETDVLDDLTKKNPSILFRRTLWQISNGMRAGSDMSIVIKDNIKGLNEEQLIQIQNYGNKLNPLIMFYMLVSVIIPALSVTFLTVISSLVNLPKSLTILIFLGLFVFVVILQIMFLGIIKSKRPSLL